MGLTRDRVFEFVEKNACEKKEFVTNTLKKNQILLSVSAITFYCAALCELLDDEDKILHELTTYTQITAYIMQVCPSSLRILMDEKFDIQHFK